MCTALTVSGCGGSGSATRATSTSSASSTWAAQTQALCTEKREAIAQLGSVHITYARIARLGLPAVKRLLDAYLGRLLGVPQTFSARQRRLTTPAAFVAAMGTANAIDAESRAATARLKEEVAGVANGVQLAGAFRSWLTSLQQLAARGDAVARRLDLPACRSGSGGPAG